MGSKSSALQLEQKAVRSVGIFKICRVHSSVRSALEKVVFSIVMRFPLNMECSIFQGSVASNKSLP